MRKFTDKNSESWQNDLLADYVIDEAELAAGELSPAEQERVLGLALAEAGLTGAKEKARRGISRRALWAACLVAVMTLAFSGLALADAAFDGRLAAFFGADQQQATALLGSGTAPLVSDSNAAGEIAATQVLGDSHNVLVLLDIAAPAGVRLDAENYMFGKPLASVPDIGGSMGYSFDTLPDADPTDNRVSMLLSLNSQNDLTGKTLSLKLGDLCTEFGNDESIVMPGEWQLEVPLDFTAIAETQKLAEPLQVQVGDGTVTFTEIAVSPLTVNLTAEADFADGERMVKSLWLSDLVDSLAVHMQDGTTVLPRQGSSMSAVDVAWQAKAPEVYTTFDMTEALSLEPADDAGTETGFRHGGATATLQQSPGSATLRVNFVLERLPSATSTTSPALIR